MEGTLPLGLHTTPASSYPHHSSPNSTATFCLLGFFQRQSLKKALEHRWFVWEVITGGQSGKIEKEKEQWEKLQCQGHCCRQHQDIWKPHRIFLTICSFGGGMMGICLWTFISSIGGGGGPWGHQLPATTWAVPHYTSRSWCIRESSQGEKLRGTTHTISGSRASPCLAAKSEMGKEEVTNVPPEAPATGSLHSFPLPLQRMFSWSPRGLVILIALSRVDCDHLFVALSLSLCLSRPWVLRAHVLLVGAVGLYLNFLPVKWINQKSFPEATPSYWKSDSTVWTQIKR